MNPFSSASSTLIPAEQREQGERRWERFDLFSSLLFCFFIFFPPFRDKGRLGEIGECGWAGEEREREVGAQRRDVERRGHAADRSEGTATAALKMRCQICCEGSPGLRRGGQREAATRPTAADRRCRVASRHRARPQTPECKTWKKNRKYGVAPIR